MHVVKKSDLDLNATLNLLVSKEQGAVHCQAGIAKVAANGYIPEDGWSKHPTEEISYIIKGRLRVETPNAKREICEGDVVFMPSDEPHRNVNLTDEEALIFWVTSPPTL